MSDILQTIVQTKHEEVALRKRKVSFEAMRADAESRVMTRGFEAALRAKISQGFGSEWSRYQLPQLKDPNPF